MSVIHIHFNGEPQVLPGDATLQHALSTFAAGALRDGSPMATALNGCHVARADRMRTQLAEGDQITTFEPITGG